MKKIILLIIFLETILSSKIEKLFFDNPTNKESINVYPNINNINTKILKNNTNIQYNNSKNKISEILDSSFNHKFSFFQDDEYSTVIHFNFILIKQIISFFYKKI